MIFKSASPATTKKIAARLARQLTAKKSGRALVIGLTGELGAGKTTFIQGLAHALGIKEKITSPTFIIMRSHNLSNHSLLTTNYSLLTHIDAYRLKNIKETKILNPKRIIENPENIILIEWADKIKKTLPKGTIWINFEHGEKQNERIIEVKNL